MVRTGDCHGVNFVGKLELPGDSEVILQDLSHHVNVQLSLVIDSDDEVFGDVSMDRMAVVSDQSSPLVHD